RVTSAGYRYVTSPDTSRFPAPGITDDRQQGRTGTAFQPLQRRVQATHLLFAADQGCPVGRPGGGDLAHADQPIGGHRLRLALQRERRDLLDLDLVAREAVRQV